MIRYVPQYTVADYELWQGDWELWNGVPVSLTPSPFGRHQHVAANVIAELRLVIRENDIPAYVLPEIDWRIGDATVVRPDILVVDHVPEQHVLETPSLVVEILSPSTAEKDRTVKLRLYEEQRVPTYLIIDPDEQAIEQYLLNENGDYRRVEVLSSLLISLNGQSLTISTALIFT